MKLNDKTIGDIADSILILQDRLIKLYVAYHKNDDVAIKETLHDIRSEIKALDLYDYEIL